MQSQEQLQPLNSQKYNFNNFHLKIDRNSIPLSLLDKINTNFAEIISIITKNFNSGLIKNSYLILEFLKVSKFSFYYGGDFEKPIEGYFECIFSFRKQEPLIQVLKKNIATLNKSAENSYSSHWEKKWFILKKDMLCYTDCPSINYAKDVINTLINKKF